METQKLDLMDEVSYLKLKLVSMEDTHIDTPPLDPIETQNNKAEVWILTNPCYVEPRLLRSFKENKKCPFL